MIQLIGVICRWCNTGFCVCRYCWRGQAYCSDSCRIAGYRRSHRRAQHHYRQTPKGKRSHCLAENRRRYRKKSQNSKKMDDQGTNPCLFRVVVSSRKRNSVLFRPDFPSRCHFCGRWGQIVAHFPRRRYGKRVYQ